MANSLWPFGGGGSSSSPPPNFLHLSRINTQRICHLTSHEEPLNPHQCRSLSSKLERTMQSIEGLVDSFDNFSVVCSCTALENFYRVSEKANQLVESCCSVNWCQASAFQIQNEEAFKEILLETSLSYNTICTLAEDINRNKGFSYNDLRWSSTFEPPSADEVLKDQVVLLERLKGLVNVTSISTSHIRSQHLGRYLLGRMNYILEQPNHEDFDVRTFSLWSDGKGPDGEWSKELEHLGGKVFTTTWLDVPCAKKMFEEMEDDEWLKEAKILASLNHPNIVKFLCCNKYETIHSWGHFIAMEKMETSLGSFIRRLKKGGTPFSIFQAVDIMSQIGYSMCYLHGNGVAHRDLKTSNVVVRSINAPHLQSFLHVKLVDFGLSKAKLKASKSNTISRPKIGTTVYMPPEAFSHGRANWFKADVYSFSVMCSVILTGDEPFENTKRSDLYRAICRGERPKLPENIPKELTSLIMEGWATDRDLRPGFVDICTRLEKLRHCLLWDHSLETSKQKKIKKNYNLYVDNLFILDMLEKRSTARQQDHSRVHPQIPVNLNDEEEWFDGDEQDGGDDTTSASGQAGATAPSTPLLVSPRSGDSDHTQQRASALHAYAVSSADAGTPRRLSYDGGGRAISASFPSCWVSPGSPGVPESGSLGLGSSTALQPRSPGLTIKPESMDWVPSLPSLSILPSLPAGLVGDGSGVDTWWT